MQLKQPKVQLPGQDPSANQPKGAQPIPPPPTPPAGQLFAPMNAPSPRQMATPNKMPQYPGQGGGGMGQAGDMGSLIQMIQKIMGGGF